MTRTDARHLLRLALIAAALAGLVAVPAASARTARPHVQPRLRLVVERVYSLNANRIALQHQRVRVRGLVAQFAPGQVMSVRVQVNGRHWISVRRQVTQQGAGGSFSVDFKAHKLGQLRAYASGSGLSAKSRSVDVIQRSAGPGSRGLSVVFLQHRLRDLRYLVDLSGHYGNATARAVLAYRKVNRMARTFSANRTIFERLARDRGRFSARFPNHGKHVEADLSRQVLALFDSQGKLFRVLVTSSGKPSTPTVRGSFHVYSKTPGTNSKGMVNSNYFFGGYAIHGYHDVPAYAASHGCLRIPIANSRFMFRWLGYGDGVDVYR